MKPLSKKTRLLSGALLVVVFLILAPIILANSFGYHLGKLGDVFTIVKTGGIYVMSDVSGAEIYIDGEYYKDSGLFLRNTLIQDLEPGQTHKITVHKEGLYKWSKELPVYESLVTESNVLMLKKELDMREIYPFFDEEQNGTTTPSEDLEITEELPEEVLIEGVIPINPEYRDLINLFSEKEDDVYSTSTSLLDDELIEKEVVGEDGEVSTSTATTTKDIPEYFIRLGIEDPDELENLIVMSDQVAWLEDGGVLVNWIDENNTPYFFYCISFDECRDEVVLDWEDDIYRFGFFPNRNDVLIVLVDSGIYAVEIDDRSERNIQPIYVGEDLDFRKNDREQIIVKDGLVFFEIDF